MTLRSLLHALCLPALLLLMLLPGACSTPDSYAVKGELRGVAGRRLELTVRTGAGVAQQELIPANDKFELTGASPSWAIGELRCDGELLSEFLVRNGLTVKLKGSVEAPVTSAGKEMKEVARFRSANAEAIAAGDALAVDSLITAYIAEKGPTPAAAFLMLTLFDEQAAGEEATAALLRCFAQSPELARLTDSWLTDLAGRLGAAAKEKISYLSINAHGDSLMSFNVKAQRASLLMFVSTGSPQRSATVASLLAELERADSLRLARDTAATPLPAPLRVVELSMAGDSARWQRELERDTVAAWSRVFIPGGPGGAAIRQLEVVRTPFYIVSAPDGLQHYRGSDLKAAADTVRSLARP